MNGPSTPIPPAATLLPSLAIVVSSALWGLYWLPMRALEDAGIPGAWPALVVNAGAALALLPGIFLMYRRIAAAPGDLIVSGLAVGAAFCLYGVSLNLSDVVRATLLFYLSPAWSTAIGVIWLGERLSLRRGAALILGFAGLMVVLKADIGLPLPQNTGDWFALISGMIWSFGSTRLFLGKVHGAYESTFAAATGTVAATGVLLLIFPAEVIGARPEAAALIEGLPVLGLGVFALVIPALLLIVWGARRLSPATVGILLLGEIVVAVASAAVLLPDEPFGTREIVGTILIAGAGLMEVLPRRRRTA